MIIFYNILRNIFKSPERVEGFLSENCRGYTNDYLNEEDYPNILDFFYQDNEKLISILSNIDIGSGYPLTKYILNIGEPEKIDILTSVIYEKNIADQFYEMYDEDVYYTDAYNYLMENNEAFRKAMEELPEVKIEYEKINLEIQIGNF